MRIRSYTLPLFGLTAILLAGNILAAEQGPTIDFSRDILPILSDKCFVCHGPDTQDTEQLRLDSLAGATSDRGGYQAINPEALEESEILVRLHSKDSPMPPQDAEKPLTANERELLARWIHQGGKYATHWAFIPPVKHRPASGTPAQDTQSTHSESIIDTFVATQLAAKGINFAPSADRATLARRAAFVLTGLPPEPEQLVGFLQDKTAGAYDRLIEELLNHSRFGEHQARYWLDAVRYGDTHGLHLDNRRGIFPYRDWVVRAFNDNLPLDQFITWQLSGDLLPNPTMAQLIATGYVRMNPSTAEGGAIPAEFQMKNNFDRVETLGSVFLGMSLTCARCHSHKYDPISQTEYYRLLAFFNSTAENSMDGNAYEYAPIMHVPQDQASWTGWIDLQAARKSLLTQATDAITVPDNFSEAIVQRWHQSSHEDRLKLLAESAGPFVKTDFHERALEITANLNSARKAFTTTLIAQDLPEPRTTQVLKRGEYNLPQGDPLEPGIVRVMGEFPSGASRTRLGLAQWLTSPNHPLVARVLVNRIWQRTFGDALVRTPEDFGLQGEQPTHPHLLDWLAVELRESGWDLKHLLRLLVRSRTFRQSSAWRQDIDDPQNRLLARGPHYRLDAEVLRDVGLWASGLLDPHMGGEGVKPYQPSGLWFALAHPGSNTKQYVQDEGNRLYRRSLYVYWKRTSPHPMMTLFDAPDRESSCVRRSRTNTPLQSLGLLNETQRVEMARKLAERLLRQIDHTAGRLDLLFTLLACRNPSATERAACEMLLKTMSVRFQESPDAARALLSQGLAPRDESLDIAELAAWTQVTNTVLASDIAILLY